MTAAVNTEQVVNVFTLGEQSQPKISTLSGGGYVAVWRSAGQNGSGFGLSGQRYNAFGQREGSEFFIETDTVGDQTDPSVAGLAGGGFAVAWRSVSADAIKAQVFDAAGAPVGVELEVNTETYSTQSEPVVVARPGGGFFVLWSSYNDDTFTYDIRGQRFGGAGAPVGAEFTVNSTTAGQQTEPAAATLPTGFVAVWSDQSGEDIRLQRFDASGVAIGAEIVVNTLTASTQYEPKVAALTGGGFVVVWTSTGGGDGSGYAVRAQRFDAAGAAVGAEFQVNQSELSSQYEPDVTATADGGFFVAWRSDYTAAGYTYDVVGRQFAANGTPAGDEVVLNQNSADTAYAPVVAGLPNGLIAALWTIGSGGGAGDGSGAAVMQRLFAEDPAAVALPQAPLIEAFAPAVTFDEAALNAAAQVLDPSIALSDADSADFDGGRLILRRITSKEDFAQYGTASQDVLGVRNAGVGAGQIGVAGATVTFGGVVIGTIVSNGAAGAALEIALNAAADAEAVETLIENLTYRTLSDDPDAEVQLAPTLSDGDGATSQPQVITVTVTPEAEALLPVGPREITVNSYTQNTQYEPDVAGLPGGGWVAVWRSNEQDGSSAGVYAQRFGADGAPSGAETRVAEANIGGQYQPAVAAIEGGALQGGHVVVWYDDQSAAEGYVRARLFGPDGAAATAEIAVPTALYSTQSEPDVSGFANGGFVVVWQAYTQATSSLDIVAQRFSAAGAPVGGQTTINAGTANTQMEPQVATLAGGGYVVTWYDQNGADGSSYGVFARVVNAAGTPVGGDIAVNSYTSGAQYEPAVAALTGGGFVIAWRDDALDGSSAGVFAQRFAANGATVGEQFRVNETTISNQYQPTVAPLPDGGFMIGWRGYGPAGGDEVFVQSYDAQGGRVDGQIQVNTGTTSSQETPRLALLDSGEVVAVWTTRDGAVDGSSYAVQARVLGDPAAYPAPGAEPLLEGVNAQREMTEAQAAAGDQLIDADGAAAVAARPGFDGGRVTVSRVDLSGLDLLFGYPDDERQDQLGVRNAGTGAGQIGVSGATVTFGGAVIGTIVSNGADGGVLDIALNAAATSAAVEALVENLTYANPSGDPAPERILRVTVSDGAGGASSANVTLRIAAQAEAPAAAGGERQTNSNIESTQDQQQVARLADGGYVVVWRSYDQDDANDYGIYAQRYDAAGVRVGGEFVINQNPANSQVTPDVAGLAGGGFAVIWQDGSASAQGYVRVRVFDAAGAPAGGEIAAPTNIYATQDQPTLAALPSGGFVAVWRSFTQATSTYDIQAQRFGAAGVKQGGEFTVNAATAGTQGDPAVAVAADGGFVVVWEDQGAADGDLYGVVARRFSAAGAPLGGDVVVNQTTAGYQYEPTIAALAGGGYVVAWREDGGRDGSGSAVFARLLTAAGVPAGDEFQVNDLTSGSQYQPEAIALADGRFVIGYYSDGVEGGSYYDVYAQTFAADGSRIDGAVRLNSAQEAFAVQSNPALAALASGYVAAWTANSTGQSGDGSGDGVFHGLFGAVPAPASAGPVLDDFGPVVQILNTAAATPVRLDPSVSLTDADSANFAGGALTLAWTDFQAGSADQLGVASGGRVAVAGSAVSVDGVVIGQIDAALNGVNGAGLRIALDADATPARTALLIEALTYANTAAAPALGDRGLSLTLSDGDGGVNHATGLIVEVTASVATNQIRLDGLETAVAFTEAQVQAGAQLIDGAVDFLYSRAAGLNGGRIEVSYLTDVIFRDGGAFETLSVLNQGSGAGQIGVAGATVSYGGVAIGTIDAILNGLNGATLRIAFNAAATEAAVEALTEAISYANAGDGPAATRQLNIRIYDAASASTAYQPVTITVTPEDDGGPKPLDGEEQVNSFTLNQQEHPAVAALTGGGHVVLWQSLYQDDESTWGVYGQRYDADGAPTGPEFRVNETTDGSQQLSAVAGLPGGGFVAVWQDDSGRDGSGVGVFARIFDAAGVPGAQFQANLEASSSQERPSVTVLSNGNILIAWRALTSAGSGDGSGYGVTGRVFTAAGAPVSGDLVLNTFTSSTQHEVSVAPNGAGGFVAVWASFGQDGAQYGVYGQRFNAAGAKVGAEFRVNTTTPSDQDAPEVARLADGGFVVVWQDQSGADGSGLGVFQQRFAANGTPVGGETLVNQYSYTTQSDAQVAATADGGWIVTWSDYSGFDGSGGGVFAQRYDAAGATVDGAFLVNEQTSSTQDESDVAVLADGRIAVVWTSETSGGAGDGSSRGVFQRLLGDPATQGGGADPVIDGLPATVTVDEAAANAGQVNLAGAVAVSDADSANFQGGRLEVVRIDSYRVADQFAAPDGATQDFLSLVSARVSIVGTGVRVDGVTVGQLVSDGQAGARLEVALNIQATAARVEALIEALSWRTPSNDPMDSRTFRVTLTDGDGDAAAPRFVTVAVTPEQDGEGPIGGERQVNTFEAGGQTASAAAGLTDGGHVVVWQSYNQDDPQSLNQGVFGQLYDALGQPRGAEFQLNETFIGAQQQPAVAALPGGGFVAGWDGNGPGDSAGVFLRLFGADGQPTGGETRINDLTSGTEDALRLATNAAGRILAVWTDSNGDTSGDGVRARLFDASGSPLTADVLVNTTQASAQNFPAVGALAGGGWIVAWSSYNQDATGTYGVYGQRLAANGSAAGGEFRINTQLEGQQYLEGVAGLTGGGSVVVFRDENGADGSGAGVYARLYDAAGAAQGAPFLVNEATSSTQRFSDVVALADGGFVIAWEDYAGLDGSGVSVQGQRYDATGARVDGQFQINEQTASSQDLPALAALTGGGFVASWTSATSGAAGDGSGDGVFSRIFGDPVAYDVANAPGLDGVNTVVTLEELLVNVLPQLIDADGAAAVIDPGGAGFVGGYVRAEMATSAYAYADQINPPDDLTQDVLGLRTGDGIAVAAGVVTVNGVAVGTVVSDGLAGQPFEIALNGAATAALVERLVENLTYSNVSDDPEATRIIRIQIGDGDGSSEPRFVSVSIAPQKDGLTPLPAFAERQVNTETASEQTQPSVAATGDGFVTVWRSYSQDATNTYGIFGQRFGGDGAPLGGEFQVNATAASNQYAPHVTSLVGGGFAVTWEGNGPGDASGVFLQRYAADGGALGGETRVNAYVNSTQHQPEAVGMPNGDIVVVWSSFGHSIAGSSGYDIYARVFNGATGAAKGPEFRVNTAVGGAQDWPHVTALADGGFVVGWETDASATGGGDLDSAAVMQRRYAFNAGTGAYAPSGAPEVVNSFIVGSQTDISLAGLTGGGWAAVWRSEGQDGSGTGVFGQIFDAAGARVGGEFRVNDQRVSTQSDPEVTALANGGFVVAFSDSNGTDGSGLGVFAQQYDATGARVDGPLQLNSETSNTQDQPAVAGLPGGFVAAWSSATSGTAGDGSSNGVFFQIFGNTAPVVQEVLTNGVEDQALTLGRALFEGGFSDADGQPLAAIRIDALPADGQLLLDGAPVASGDQIAAAQLAAGLLRYVPNPNANGEDSFAWSGFDGIAYSAAPVLARIAVAAVNDPVALEAGPDVTLAAGASLNRAITLGDPDGDTFTVTVNYGEGGPDVVFTTTSTTPLLSNVYEAGGSYTVTVQVSDGAGSTETDSFTVTAVSDGGGTGGPDVLTGGPGDDVLSGLGGDDTLSGLGGADTLCGGEGNDVLLGGLGDDRLYGEGGDDTLTGGAGADVFRMAPGGGSDVITDFEDGVDRIDLTAYDQAAALAAVAAATFSAGGYTLVIGGETLRIEGLASGGFSAADVITGAVSLVGGPAAEKLLGGAGNDTVRGAEGADTIVGFGGNDILRGQDGDDLIDGGDGRDRLEGNGGADTLLGGADNDTLFGNIGNDVLEGGDGADQLSGNEDDDTLSGGAGADSLFGGAGADVMDGGADADLLQGDDGADVMDGGAGDDRMFGGRDNDVMEGGDGADEVNGQQGDDVVNGGAGNDRLFGIGGADTLDGGSGIDNIFGGTGNDSLSGGTENDKLFGEDGDDALDGGDGADQLFGGAGGDAVFGGAGDDILFGDAGNDILDGGAGVDTLFGGVGDDTLDGGRGAGVDRATGGGGADTFRYQAGDERLVVTDFSFAAGDRIDLVFINPADFALWTLTPVAGGSATLIDFDGDADGINEIRLDATAAAAIDQSWFV